MCFHLFPSKIKRFFFKIRFVFRSKCPPFTKKNQPGRWLVCWAWLVCGFFSDFFRFLFSSSRERERLDSPNKLLSCVCVWGWDSGRGLFHDMFICNFDSLNHSSPLPVCPLLHLTWMLLLLYLCSGESGCHVFPCNSGSGCVRSLCVCVCVFQSWVEGERRRERMEVERE